jgi:hypothetical protein
LSKELPKGADFGEILSVVRCIKKVVSVLERQSHAKNEPDMPVVIKDTPRLLEIGLEVMKFRPRHNKARRLSLPTIGPLMLGNASLIGNSPRPVQDVHF